MHRCRFVSVLFASFLLSAPAVAANVGSWTYKKLFKEADVVVIANLESTKETDELHVDAETKTQVRIVLSKLNCVQVLKGELVDKSIEFRHWYPKRGQILDGLPSPVRLAKTKRYTQGMTDISTTLSYLVFLRRTKDNKLEPVSGFIGAIYSVKELHRPPSGDIEGFGVAK